MTCTRCNHEGTKKFGYCGRKRVQRYRCQRCSATFVDPNQPKPLGAHYIDVETASRALELMMEGTSVRAISRLTGLHIHTILSLMVTAGQKCQRLLDAKVRGLHLNYVQADELHTFVGARDKHMRKDSPETWGSAWTWLALDSESKLIISHYIGKRDSDSAYEFIRDLSTRTEGVFQLTSDGLRHYVDAVDAHYATSIHFAQLVKMFSAPDFIGPDWFGATSRVVGTIPSVKSGRPDPRFVSTSHVERLNLSVRMHLRRFARRTNAHSRKLENLKAAVALWVGWYNFVRLNTAVRMTPAMAAGISDHIWSMQELLVA